MPFARLAALSVMVCLVPCTAFGQSLTMFDRAAEDATLRSDVAGARQQPQFEPPGIAMGGFILRPDLTQILSVDSNVFNRDARVTGDAFLTIRPSLRLASNWGRHGVTLSARGELRRFASISLQNVENFKIDGQGVYDIAYGMALFGHATVRRESETKGAVGERVIDGGPSTYDAAEIGIGGDFALGDFRLGGEMLAEKQSFHAIRRVAPAPQIDQSFRDINRLSLRARGGYEAFPGLISFVEAQATRVRSRFRDPCCLRDSSALRLSLGVRGDLGSRFASETSIGYLRRRFRDPLLRDYSGLTYTTKIDWYPTSLVTVQLSAGRGIADSALPSVAGIVTNRIELHGHYEWLRNLNIGLRLSRAHESYREIGLAAVTRTLKLDARFDLGRMLRIGIELGPRERRSTDRTRLRPFHGTEASASLRVAL